MQASVSTQAPDQIVPVPAEPIQPGCNADWVFASSQCKDAWQQYQTAVQVRDDIIQHNTLAQARIAGAEQARQAANQALQQHDAEIAALRVQIAALTAQQRVLVMKGAGLGAGSILVLILIGVVIGKSLSRFAVVRKGSGQAVSAGGGD